VIIIITITTWGKSENKTPQLVYIYKKKVRSGEKNNGIDR